MLDRQKLLIQLSQLNANVFGVADQELTLAAITWNLIKDDANLASLLKTKKWSLLIPSWQANLGQIFEISVQLHPYKVLAVDGSQIYYDRHQGPACYLINVGSAFFSYGVLASSVQFESVPSVIFSEHSDDLISPEFVNLKREQVELTHAVDKAINIVAMNHEIPFVCMFDGTLIFFQAEGQAEQKDQIFKKYMQQLQVLYDQKILHVGYISFPKSKELINILKLSVAEFDEKNLDRSNSLNRLTDMQLVQLFLKPGQRSVVFESKAPICYLYPKNLKPYFCYLNVGAEIARLEFPAWIAHEKALVDRICAVAFDQACKGNGYPVCLFEAHEQAVIKAYDRDFFYLMIQKMTQQADEVYQISKKSLKKAFVAI